jgi:hypothetical protein
MILKRMISDCHLEVVQPLISIQAGIERNIKEIPSMSEEEKVAEEEKIAEWRKWWRRRMWWTRRRWWKKRNWRMIF